jgi:hypothetical protein
MFPQFVTSVNVVGSGDISFVGGTTSLGFNCGFAVVALQESAAAFFGAAAALEIPVAANARIAMAITTRFIFTPTRLLLAAYL